MQDNSLDHVLLSSRCLCPDGDCLEAGVIRVCTTGPDDEQDGQKYPGTSTRSRGTVRPSEHHHQ